MILCSTFFLYAFVFFFFFLCVPMFTERTLSNDTWCDVACHSSSLPTAIGLTSRAISPGQHSRDRLQRYRRRKLARNKRGSRGWENLFTFIRFICDVCFPPPPKKKKKPGFFFPLPVAWEVSTIKNRTLYNRHRHKVIRVEGYFFVMRYSYAASSCPPRWVPISINIVALFYCSNNKSCKECKSRPSSWTNNTSKSHGPHMRKCRVVDKSEKWSLRMW